MVDTRLEKMERLRWALRWRFEACASLVDNITIKLRSWLFVVWYRDILGAVVGARGVKVRQRVRIVGPGTVHIGDNVKFGYKRSPSWHGREIRIITKFKDSILHLGNGTSVNNNNAFVVVKCICISDLVRTGHDCQFYDSDLHSIDPLGRSTLGDRGGKQRDVIIGMNAMIGAQVTIGAGTEIGENSVVAMRSHARWKKYPNNCVIVGDPARVVGKIDDLLNKSNPAGIADRSE